MTEIINKPWGEETLYTSKDSPYTFKQLKINANCRLSLQSHTQKIETLVLVEGEVDLIIGPDLNSLEIIHMELKKDYTIQAGTIHRLSATKDAIIFEASTPEIGTTIRYEDDYNRQNETKN
ncbi:MAG: cupin [Candidatus Shapirobacteria bacterium]